MSKKMPTKNGLKKFLKQTLNDIEEDNFYVPEKLLVRSFCNKNNKVCPIGLYLHEEFNKEYSELKDLDWKKIPLVFVDIVLDYDNNAKEPYLLPAEKAIKRMLKVLN